MAEADCWSPMTQAKYFIQFLTAKQIKWESIFKLIKTYWANKWSLTIEIHPRDPHTPTQPPPPAGPIVYTIVAIFLYRRPWQWQWWYWNIPKQINTCNVYKEAKTELDGCSRIAVDCLCSDALPSCSRKGCSECRRCVPPLLVERGHCIQLTLHL